MNWVQVQSQSKGKPALMVEICVFDTAREMQSKLRRVVKCLYKNTVHKQHTPVGKRVRGYTIYSPTAPWLQSKPKAGYALVFLSREILDSGVVAHEFHHVAWFSAYPKYRKLHNRAMNSVFARKLCEDQAETVESLVNTFTAWWNNGNPPAPVFPQPQTLTLWEGKKL